MVDFQLDEETKRRLNPLIRNVPQYDSFGNVLPGASQVPSGPSSAPIVRMQPKYDSYGNVLPSTQQPQQVPPVIQQQLQPIQQQNSNSQRVSNLVNPNPLVQPGQLQNLNPYAGLGYGNINPEGFQREQAAISQQGRVTEQAQRQYGQQMAQVTGQQAQALQGLQSKSKENIAEYQKGSKDLDSKISEVQTRFPSLSRDQVWDSYSLGEKAVKSIGTVLGGIGAGMTGGSNQALDLINRNIDSVISANNRNFQQSMEVLNTKRAKSAQDFEFARQQLQDSSTLQNNIFTAMQARIDAQFKSAMAPAAKAQLEAASAQVAQRQASANQQTSVQNLQLQLQGRQWGAQMAMNPRAVNLGTDQSGKPIQAVAASDKSAETLRSEIPQMDQKINAVKELIGYVSTAPGQEGRKQTFIGKNLEGMKEVVAKLYGLNPKDMPDITQTIGRDATDFYNQLLTQAQQQKQNIINANTLK